MPDEEMTLEEIAELQAKAERYRQRARTAEEQLLWHSVIRLCDAYYYVWGKFALLERCCKESVIR